MVVYELVPWGVAYSVCCWVDCGLCQLYRENLNNLSAPSAPTMPPFMCVCVCVSGCILFTPTCIGPGKIRSGETCGISSVGIKKNFLLMVEILHHLGCMKPCK